MTQRDMTHRDMTHRDMTHRDMTPRDMTHRGMTHRDIPHRDMTHRDMTHAYTATQHYGYVSLFPIDEMKLPKASVIRKELFPDDMKFPKSSALTFVLYKVAMMLRFERGRNKSMSHVSHIGHESCRVYRTC